MSSSQHDVETDHEYDGIKEFDNPLPFWWLMTFLFAVVFAVFYWMANHSLPALGSFDDHAYDMAEYNKQLILNAISPEELAALVEDPAAVARGEAVFKAQCASCHGQQGEGLIGPNLTDAYWLHGQKPTDIWATVSLGQTSKGMPGWRAVLGAQQVGEVTAYVVSIKDTPVEGKRAEGVNEAGDPP